MCVADARRGRTERTNERRNGRSERASEDGEKVGTRSGTRGPGSRSGMVLDYGVRRRINACVGHARQSSSKNREREREREGERGRERERKGEKAARGRRWLRARETHLIIARLRHLAPALYVSRSATHSTHCRRRCCFLSVLCAHRGADGSWYMVHSITDRAACLALHSRAASRRRRARRRTASRIVYAPTRRARRRIPPHRAAPRLATDIVRRRIATDDDATTTTTRPSRTASHGALLHGRMNG